MKVKSESEVTQSCPTLSDPMDRSLLGFSVHGIFQVKKSLLNLNYNGYLNLKKKNHLDVYLNFDSILDFMKYLLLWYKRSQGNIADSILFQSTDFY